MSNLIERWGRFEFSCSGPKVENPFQDAQLTARFWQGEQSFEVKGFYDGDNNYRVRFMPPTVGVWQFQTDGSHAELQNHTGKFEVGEPSVENHGPVEVAHMWHFAYADGKPYKPIGTTCYVWTHQSAELQAQTLKSLEASPFNKLRMCVFPKFYDWNRVEPALYPFEGEAPNKWNYDRFNPAFFQHLETQIDALLALGIECDLILFHPYDDGHWGFDRMAPEVDDAYLCYITARLSAFRNVWWSLANEYDFMEEKKPEDWDRFFHIVKENDPFNHLCSIHNGFVLYDHNKPWVSHASIQNGSAVTDAARAVILRDAYRKPIVYDEVVYEGDVPRRWGNLSGEEMVHRFWEGTIAGTYVGHGETFDRPDVILWWSKGGTLHGESPARLGFLLKVLEDGPAEGLEPIDKWQNPQYAGQASEYYLVYLGANTPSEWKFSLPKARLSDGMEFEAEILDTWNMTVTPVEGTFRTKRRNMYWFEDEARRSIKLSGNPWMALRLRRVGERVEHKEEFVKSLV